MTLDELKELCASGTYPEVEIHVADGDASATGFRESITLGGD